MSQVLGIKSGTLLVFPRLVKQIVLQDPFSFQAAIRYGKEQKEEEVDLCQYFSGVLSLLTKVLQRSLGGQIP